MIFASSALLSITLTLIVYKALKPFPKLSSKLSPYDTVVRVRLSGSATSIGTGKKLTIETSSILFELFRPMYESAQRLILKIASIDDFDRTTLKLLHAGLEPNVETYRTHLVKKILLFTGAGIFLGTAIGSPKALIFFPLILGFIAFSKTKASLDKRIENRRLAIRSELYTVDQLLALYVRTGSGVSQALLSIAHRTNGIVSQEINEVLKRVRAGIPIDESLYIAARNTPEPHAMRTYKLLAAASHRGVDLTQGLLDLAKDLRRTLREDIKATGAKRRAAMLLPTIGILAPIMLLFVAAPIPSIVLTGN